MTPPHRRLWLAAGAALLALAAAVAAGEWRGWPFLARPLEKALSAALHRDVHFSAGSDAFRVRFLGRLRLSAARFDIDAPAWSRAPHLLQASDVALELRYADLWRAWRGAVPRVQSLRARALDVQLERRADGRASWQFGGPAQAPRADTPAPVFGELHVAGGALRYDDALLDISLQATAALAYDQPLPRLTAQAEGRYRRHPMHVELAASGALPWAADAVQAAPVPLTLKATVGAARLDFKGQAVEVLHLRGLTGQFRLSGPSLAAVGDPVGVTLPTTGAFSTEGQLAKEDDVWYVGIDQARIGASRLSGRFTYDRSRALPLLSGRLGGTRLLLADLGPVVGTTPAPTVSDAGTAPATPTRGPGKVLPDRPFDLPALRAMDADILVDIAEVDLNTSVLEPLRPLRTHLRLAAGVLTLADLDARASGGHLAGELRLDGRGETAAWTAKLHWDGVQLERWVHQARADGGPPYVTGRLLGSATLEGQGRSTAEILGSLKGRARTDLRDGTVSHLGLEVAGLDLAQALGVLVQGDEALPVPCAVADLVADGGVFRPRLIALDTSDSVLLVDGSLSLASETLDLRAVVAPKDFSPLALRTPLHVRGSFADPAVSLEKAPLARKLGSSLLLALVNPLAAVLPLVDTGDSDDARRGAASCQRLQQRIASAGKRP